MGTIDHAWIVGMTEAGRRQQVRFLIQVGKWISWPKLVHPGIIIIIIITLFQSKSDNHQFPDRKLNV
jgi:hypothetical protein